MTLSILAHFAVRLAKALLIATGVSFLFYEMDKFQGGKFYEENTVLVYLLIVALITGLQLALDMLPISVTHEHVHIVRGNRMPTVRRKPEVSWTPQETPDTPSGFYGLTVRIDDPFTDWPYTRQLLRMMTHDLLNNKNGHASNNYLPGYKEAEVSAYSKWLLHRGLASKVRNSAVLHAQGRLDLQDLYPTMQS